MVIKKFQISWELICQRDDGKIMLNASVNKADGSPPWPHARVSVQSDSLEHVGAIMLRVRDYFEGELRLGNEIRGPGWLVTIK